MKAQRCGISRPSPVHNVSDSDNEDAWSCWLPSTIFAHTENDGAENRALNAVQAGKNRVEQSDDKVTKQETLPGEKMELVAVDDGAATEEDC